MYGPRTLQWPAPEKFQNQDRIRWCKMPVPQGEVMNTVKNNTNEHLLSWENTQPYFASVARMHFNLQSPQPPSSDMDYLMAYLGYQSVWFADDTNGKDYDHNAALLDLLSLEDALKRLKGRIIVAEGARKHNDAPEKKQVVEGALDWEHVEDDEWSAAWMMCGGPIPLPAPQPKVIPQAEEINLD
jgi:hypothetical protein